MRLPLILSSTIFLSTTLPFSSAYMVTFYTSSHCRSGAPTTLTLRPEHGCQTHRAGESSSQIIKGDGSDKSFYLVYFSEEKCDPDTMIKKEDLSEGYSSTCSDTMAGYGSFEVWDVCEQPGCLE